MEAPHDYFANPTGNTAFRQLPARCQTRALGEVCATKCRAAPAAGQLAAAGCRAADRRFREQAAVSEIPRRRRRTGRLRRRHPAGGRRRAERPASTEPPPAWVPAGGAATLVPDMGAGPGNWAAPAPAAGGGGCRCRWPPLTR